MRLREHVRYVYILCKVYILYTIGIVEFISSGHKLYTYLSSELMYVCRNWSMIPCDRRTPGIAPSHYSHMVQGIINIGHLYSSGLRRNYALESQSRHLFSPTNYHDYLLPPFSTTILPVSHRPPCLSRTITSYKWLILSIALEQNLIILWSSELTRVIN